ncbi:MAG: hypothetical protein K1X67_22670 [Fimbriimonadaceae bacterium]|nr:hypothetical protein [Fimbriimonadaceae bacterium]
MGACRYIVGDPSRLRQLAAASAICLDPHVLLWISGQADPPLDWPDFDQRSGSLVIAQEAAHVSAKAWRNIRSKLEFREKRWQVPTYREVENWFARDRTGWPYGHDRGHAAWDGNTVFAHADRHGIGLLAIGLWGMSYSPSDLSSWHLDGCLRDPDWLYYVCHSRFRRSRRPQPTGA